MGRFNINIQPLGENYLLCSWPAKISVEISEELLAFEQFIFKKFNHFILASNPAYASLAIRFEIKNITFSELKLILLKAYQDFVFNKIESKKYWEIPVCYDSELGPDLLEACDRTSLDLETFIKLHTKPFYRIYFIGFLPGFLYLGGLNEKLFIPRKSTPRLKVPMGAVGIAGSQTGIYPQNSPGGWQLIGQTKVSLFHSNQKVPTPFQAGEHIKFTSISKADFTLASTLPILKTRVIHE